MMANAQKNLESRRKIKAEILEEYINKYIDVMPTKTLAKKINEENMGLFPSIDNTRKQIRYYIGSDGDRSRSRNKKIDVSQRTPSTQKEGLDKLIRYKEKINTSAKILLLDIETAPIVAYVWDIWNQNVSNNQIVSDWFCLTWAAKWLFEKKVYSAKLTSSEALEQDDKRIMQSIWDMVNEADIIITHNGQKFDMRRLSTRFIIHGMPPPLPYQQIDTLLHVRRSFDMTSNKLDYVNKLLNLERKKDTGGFDLWAKCYKGDLKALHDMEKYNVQDVRILEETYLTIRAWIKPHPNVALFILDEKVERCPTCGSHDLAEQGKDYHTTVNVYEELRCNNCGATGRRRKSKLDIKQRRNILSSTPK